MDPITAPFLSSAMDALTDPIAVFDTSGTLVTANRAWRALEAENPTATVGPSKKARHSETAPFPQSVDSIGSGNLAAGIRSVLSGENAAVCLEHARQPRSGKRCYTGQVTAFDHEGERFALVRMGNLARNDQEGIRTDESEAWYRAMVESSTDFLFLLDRNGYYLTANHRLEQCALEKGCAAAGSHFRQLHPPDVADFYQQQIDRVLETGVAVEFEHEMPDSDGVHYHLDMLYPVYRDGHIWAIGGICRDITRQKKAEATLREREKRYRLHFENVSDVIFSLNANLEFSEISPVVEKILGYRPDQLVGKNVLDSGLIADGSLETAAAAIERAMGGAAVPPTEIAFIARDGRRIDGEVSLEPYRVDGKVTLLLGVGRDITAQKAAKLTLKASEEKYRRFHECMRDGYAYVDMKGTIIEFNQEFQRLLGYTDAEIRRLTYNDITPGKWQAQEAEIIRKTVLTRGYSDLYEKEYIRKDGGTVPIEIQTYLHRDENGEPAGMWAFLRDISERKSNEAALQAVRDNLERTIAERTRELRQANLELEREVAERKASQSALARSELQKGLLLNSTVEAIYGVDREGKCTFVNASCLKLLGYDQAADLIGKDMHAVVHHSHTDGTPYPPSECPILGVILDGCSIHRDDEVMWRKDGSPLPVAYRTHPVHTAGVVTGAVITFLDISDQKRIQKEKQELEGRLRHAQKMEALGTLAGGIAHDFNNILGAIIGYGEIMELFEVPEDSDIRDSLSQVLRSAYRAKELVNQILTFSRRGEVEMRPVSLSEIIADTLKLLRASLPASIQIDKKIRDLPGTVLADPSQMHQVVMNLCTNAAQAMGDKGGRLQIQLDALQLREEMMRTFPELVPGSYARLSVSDTGAGIPQTIGNRIFEPYFTTKPAGEGTGLGLAVAHGIAQQHGGAIRFESEPGHGTTFVVLLPLAATDEKAYTEGALDQPLKSGTGRILFVDDEALLVASSKMALGQLGYEVDTETDSRLALNRFMGSPDAYDMIISDQTMPGLSGLELASAIKGVRPEIPFILCTGFSASVTQERIAEAGIDLFLLKPISLQRLSDAVHRLLNP